MHNYKSKQYLFATLKVVVLFAALLFIYTKMTHSSHFRWDLYQLYNTTTTEYATTMILILVLLSVGNWVFEILKWKALISSIKKLSFIESAQQVLSAQTASLFTPAKLGEYGTKTLFFDATVTKKVLFFNLIGNFTQLTATMVAGIFGLFFLVNERFPEYIFTLIISILITVIVTLILRNFFGKLTSFFTPFQKLVRNIKALSSKKLMQVFCFSLVRYLCFSLQFYLLLNLLHPVPFWETWLLIFAYYLISSALPVMQFFDWVIKSSVALWIFPHLNPATLLLVTSGMWLFNSAGPALIGTVFWWRLNPVAEKLKTTS